ncbi:MAG: hypothetical protein KGL39_24045 [Patescibacteria group bacterium]|nr:hypothetical protein [Patescibacteria group bacterium]
MSKLAIAAIVLLVLAVVYHCHCMRKKLLALKSLPRMNPMHMHLMHALSHRPQKSTFRSRFCTNPWGRPQGDSYPYGTEVSGVEMEDYSTAYN